MTETKSSTKDVSGLTDFLIDTKTYETKISDGKTTVTSRATTPEKSQTQASDKWNKR